ncbi:hypothetical protein EDD18DRAFT_1327864 [Armillaria luteobubalina]|uniref:Uncharacterized protein n=1 Tax=Armillaria luteobubalina TaxID=153913 RepID=A0AA39QGP3_9AGAR|nr:hypothetical protein EDD18DRAFT_1327864 [Armillaria luteobubalina]
MPHLCWPALTIVLRDQRNEWQAADDLKTRCARLPARQRRKTELSPCQTALHVHSKIKLSHVTHNSKSLEALSNERRIRSLCFATRRIASVHGEANGTAIKHAVDRTGYTGHTCLVFEVREVSVHRYVLKFCGISTLSSAENLNWTLASLELEEWTNNVERLIGKAGGKRGAYDAGLRTGSRPGFTTAWSGSKASQASLWTEPLKAEEELGSEPSRVGKSVHCKYTGPW